MELNPALTDAVLVHLQDHDDAISGGKDPSGITYRVFGSV